MYRKLLALLIILVALASCAGNSNTSDTTKVNDAETAVSKKADGFVVEKTPAAKLKETLKEYTYSNIFSAKIPEGWSVSTGGTDWYLWVRIYDPENPSLQVFKILSSTGILKSDRAKSFYQQALSISGDYYLYGSASEMIVNETGTMVEFFEDFMDYIAWIAKFDPTFSGFEYPNISAFQEIESWDMNDFYSSISIDDKLIHGEYIEPLSQQRSEGIFSGAFTRGLSMTDPGYDVGFYIVYDVNGMTAPYGLLNEYQDLLSTIHKSINYTESFISTAMRNQQINFKNAQQVGEIMAQTSQMIVDGYNQRQQTYDRVSQEYSDATMGYDRYYDKQTGELYKVEHGVMDNYTGDRYELAGPDSQYYNLPVAGYIYK